MRARENHSRGITDERNDRSTRNIIDAALWIDYVCVYNVALLCTRNLYRVFGTFERQVYVRRTKTVWLTFEIVRGSLVSYSILWFFLAFFCSRGEQNDAIDSSIGFLLTFDVTHAS